MPAEHWPLAFNQYIIISGILVANLLLLTMLFRSSVPRDLSKRLSAIEADHAQDTGARLKLDAAFGQQIKALGELRQSFNDRFDGLDANQSKLLGHIAGTDRLVAEMLALYKEMGTTFEQSRSQLVNVATRLGVLEVEVRHIDGIVSRLNGGQK